MQTDHTGESEVIVACTPDNVPAESRGRWLELGKEVYALVQEVKELPDSYACRLPGDAATLQKAAEYVSLDRLCCTFMRWSLVVEPQGGPLWLHLTGPQGTKEMTRDSFETTDLLREEVASAAGFNVTRRIALSHPGDVERVVANYA